MYHSGGLEESAPGGKVCQCVHVCATVGREEWNTVEVQYLILQAARRNSEPRQLFLTRLCLVSERKAPPTPPPLGGRSSERVDGAKLTNLMV